MTIEPDAWKQQSELEKRFTRHWNVSRFTLEARAHDRQLILRTTEGGLAGSSVSTMRLLANQILEACDFVEKSNPKWTGQFPKPEVPVSEAIQKRLKLAEACILSLRDHFPDSVSAATLGVLKCGDCIARVEAWQAARQ